MYYFVRVNGDTAHNNPAQADAYVPGEPPVFPETRFNYVSYCLREGIIRIGWPDTGDLRKPPKTGALARAYDLRSLPPYIREYLHQFRDIGRGSVLLMPNRDDPGELYIGDVVASYSYFHQPPRHPYECAHRLGVRWDRGSKERPQRYQANSLGIGIRGGFWLRAFQILERTADFDTIRERIDAAREERATA